MTTFETAVELIFKHEGGYVNHPSDPGGATNMGITLRTLCSHRQDRSLTATDVQDLSKEEAAEIYYTKYWIAAHCDTLPEGIAMLHFDSAVNHGVRQAIRFLQAAVGTVTDGAFGPITAEAVSAHTDRHMVFRYAAHRMLFYGSLRTFSTFGGGWSRRLMSTLDVATR